MTVPPTARHGATAARRVVRMLACALGPTTAPGSGKARSHAAGRRPKALGVAQRFD
jgi:hypothetical protein